MDIPAALLYTILSSVAEMAMEPAPDPQILNEPAGLARSAARRKQSKGVMQPPRGDGFLIIDDQQWRLAPTAQFRSRHAT
jgi:hypothetical protein